MNCLTLLFVDLANKAQGTGAGGGVSSISVTFFHDFDNDESECDEF